MTSIADPLVLPCGAVLPNRLAKAAMTEGLADPQGRATPELARLYGLWADGGSGLLITGNVQIDRDHLERPGNVIIQGPQDEAALAGLTAMASAGTRAGNHIWMQISHAGRQTQITVNPHPKAPSAVAVGLPGKQFGLPEALTEPEILDLIERFGVAAEVAKATGYTGVQIHAAHGYLLSQFLSPRANLRRDQWGGTLENRARMLMAVVARVRAGVGPEFPIGVKLNSADFQKGGFAFEDSMLVARWLQDAGVDLLEISGGSYEQPAMMDIPGMEAPDAPPKQASTIAREAYFVDFAKTMRASLTMPLMVTGGFRTRRAMNTALEQGGADVIGLGRPLCVDTAGPAKLLAGAEELDRWENRLKLLPPWLSFLGSLKMMRAVEGFAVTYWYYAQIDAIARTGKANIGIAPFSALLSIQKAGKAWLKARK
ncbi:NADH:flavin oxidoreductase/NADH oxidase family protein [Novosphingobium sp.]|uniref:NADH:flavin oxidoreductase/NADH oxidase family protein n=1 Tax=Novosphingobium sp. TaxID=1874826 RepID=UPI001DC7B103|nr:NADH:flavin oxidoreductase/NADH oxidase family protein [Novosphingobium sp.]MBX9662404.1 NADH:flavin oxidoreductase/NADH oxidase family protein [Novosphingobium sp.]